MQRDDKLYLPHNLSHVHASVFGKTTLSDAGCYAAHAHDSVDYAGPSSDPNCRGQVEATRAGELFDNHTLPPFICFLQYL